MRRQDRTALVAVLYTALVYSTCVYCGDKDDFAQKLQQDTEKILGISKFQEYLLPRNNENLQFVVSDPNGMDHVQWIASDISRHVRARADGVIRLKEAIIRSFGTRKPMPKCCPTGPLNLRKDPRFPHAVNTNTGCLFGKEPPDTNANGEPVVEGISDELVAAMRINLRTIPGVKWQYYGNKDGVMYSFPAKTSCHRQTYDPRLRPWYSFTATNPKDIIIMIDKSEPMKTTYLTNTESKLTVAIKASRTAIDSLNPNDNVGVLAFDNDVSLPVTDDPCYHSQLALATKVNKVELKKFVTGLQVLSDQRANYSRAFERAFELFSATSNSSESTSRRKVILLLTYGNPVDSLSQISQTILAGNQLVGSQVTIISFSMNSDPSEDGILRNISQQSGGHYVHLSDPNVEQIKMQIGVYYNYFAKRSDNNDVVFTVPYNDSGGLGMVTSACLPIVADNEFQGVTCMDIPIDTMFSPIIDFHLAGLSYAFLIDSRGRVLLHPLLPKPRNYKLLPIFLDMESVEISEATVDIKASMISGTTGNKTVTDLRLFSSRGYSLHDGVTLYVGKATYYWSPISVMNASIGLVIVDGEVNISLSWTGDYPPVLLTDQLRRDDTNGKCNNYGRIASTDASAVKLSPMCFVEPYNYTEQVITGAMLRDFDNYLRDRTTQTSFTVMPGVREAVAMTYDLERIWKNSSNGSVGDDQFGKFVLYRYVGTREGVYRIYPAIRIPLKYDPTQQPWYRRAQAQRNRITISTKADRNGDVITSLAKAFVNDNDQGNDEMGVVGADVSFSSFYDFLLSQFNECSNRRTRECFAIDRSGFVFAHKDFIDNPPSMAVHITTKEPEIAADMVDLNIMTTDSCVNFADITNQRFYVVDLRDGERELKNGKIYAMPGFDMNVVVKNLRSTEDTGSCTCPRNVDFSDRLKCEPGQQCQCPCYTSTDYSYCTGRFTTNNTKTCYPSTLPIYLVDLSEEESQYLDSLSSCQTCRLITDERLCNTTGCSWKAGRCHIREIPGSTTDSPYRGCGSLCLGLVVGLLVAIVVVAVIVVVIIVCRRRQSPGLGSSSDNNLPMHKAQHRTVVQVGPDVGAASGYAEIPAMTTQVPDDKKPPVTDDDVYLHPTGLKVSS